MKLLGLPFTPRFILLTLALVMTAILANEFVMVHHYTLIIGAALVVCAPGLRCLASAT